MEGGREGGRERERDREGGGREGHRTSEFIAHRATGRRDLLPTDGGNEMQGPQDVRIHCPPQGVMKCTGHRTSEFIAHRGGQLQLLLLQLQQLQQLEEQEQQQHEQQQIAIISNSKSNLLILRGGNIRMTPEGGEGKKAMGRRTNRAWEGGAH